MILSNVLLWVILLALILINFALIRQVGVLYERVAPTGALAINNKIKVGQQSPEFTLQTLSGELVRIGGQDTDGRSQLLFFVSPDCPVCKTLLPALVSAARAESDWLYVMLASDGSEQDHQAYIEKHKLEQFPYINSEVLGRSYGISKLPYAVIIDEQGKIASMGIVNSREHLDSLFESKEQNIVSIQDYFSKTKSIASAEVQQK